ncbi:MAG: thymidylate synthase, partial [Candidatus Nanopelagicus sp.]
CGYKVGELIISTGDTHIYTDHVEQVKEQLNREPYSLPTLMLNTQKNNIFEMTMDDIYLDGYKSHDAIKAKMAV